MEDSLLKMGNFDCELSREIDGRLGVAVSFGDEGPLDGGLEEPSPSPRGLVEGSFNLDPGGLSLLLIPVLPDVHGRNPPLEPGLVGGFSNGPSKPPDNVLNSKQNEIS